MASSSSTTADAIGHGANRSSALAEQLLNFTLFVTVALSSIVFIEPSPHDAMMFVLLLACVTARVPFDRKLVPLLVLTIIWLTGGGISLLHAADDKKSLQYFGTSVYLGMAGIMFACLFSGGSMVRLAIMNRAYLIAALIAAAAGYIGYFHLLPGSQIFLVDIAEDASLGARISATFKDPNVFGPFLVFPLLVLILGFLTHRITFLRLVAVAVLSGGLFLSFSRGAWVHFAVSAVVAIAISYVTASSGRMRRRIIACGVVIALALVLLIIALSSIETIHDMLLERAKVIQPYDVGSGGRFSLQQLALGVILDHPSGMGPFGFSDIYGGQQHNVYLQGFLVYGWLGGPAYLTIVLTTLMIGLRSVLQPTPWQLYLIAAYAAFVGEAGEGIIIDSDHWRHFFLLIGLVWGLSVATINFRRRQFVN